MMPLECPHGKVLDWGDFGEGPAEGCVECDALPTITDQIDALTAERDRLVALLRDILVFLQGFGDRAAAADDWHMSTPQVGFMAALCREIAAVVGEGSDGEAR
jgi:hypothetical protein